MCTGIRIKLKRIERGFSAKDFAEISGISRYQLSAIENGRVKEPRFSTIRKIANALNCSLEEIVPNGEVENND